MGAKTKEYATAQLVRQTIDGESIAVDLGYSSQKGTEQAVAHMKILDGKYEGRTLPWIGFFTSAEVADRTLEQLRFLGLTGDAVSEARSQPMDNVVPVTIEEEEYEGKPRARVAWINKPGSGGGFVMEKRMPKEDALLFDAKLKARLASKGVVSVKSETLAPITSNGAPRAGSDIKL
jgi:hypothetical protein